MIPGTSSIPAESRFQPLLPFVLPVHSAVVKLLPAVVTRRERITPTMYVGVTREQVYRFARLS